MKRDATHGIPFLSGNCHYFSNKQYFVIAPVIDQEGKRTSEFHIFDNWFFLLETMRKSL